MRKLLLVLTLSFVYLFIAVSVSAQDYVEVRGGFTKDGLTYRYVDYNHTFKNDVVVDIAHYGSPGQNELWIGAGKYVKFNDIFSATFAAYLVAGKESKQLGPAISSWGSGGSKKVGVSYQTYAFFPIKGGVKKYLAIDSLDITYKASKKVEIGSSMGMYWVGSNKNLIAGPILRINDKLGSFNFSVRGGAYTEFRVGRTFNLDISKLHK